MLVNVILDSLPILIAVYALLNMSRVNANSSEIIIGKLLCILMIICQSIWIQSYVSGFNIVIPLVNKLWDLFNILSMTLIVILSNRLKNEN